MGRHSAPDDEERALPAVAALPEHRPRPGRHSRPADERPEDGSDHSGASGNGDRGELLHLIAERVTERLPAPEVESEPASGEPGPAPAAEPAEPPESTSTELVLAEPAERKVVAEIGKGNHPNSADLELLRRHSDLRARVIAAVVVPFVIYTAVMYLIAALPVYFIWVWIPLVTAGVLAGSLLDSAHRRNARDRARDAEPGAG